MPFKGEVVVGLIRTRWALGLVSIVFFVGCGSGHDAAAAKKDQDAEKGKQTAIEAVPVEVTQIGRGPIESILRMSANLEAEDQVRVLARTSNRVVALLAEEGDQVTANQVLLRLEDDAQRTQAEKTKAQLDKVKREYERQKSLYAQNLISTQTFNDATFEMEQAELNYRDAVRNLEYAEVRAPIAGTITSRQVNLGDQVNVNDYLFDIVDFNSIVARIYVPEKHLSGLRLGLRARISAQSLGDLSIPGRVRRIAPIVDPRTGTVKITVGVDEVGPLRPGLYVDVALVMATEANAILIPKRALVYDNDQIFVFRLEADHRVARLAITARLSDSDNIEPVDGVAPGDQIVTAGQTGLKDGALVQLPGEAAVTEPDGDGSSDADSTKAADQSPPEKGPVTERQDTP